MSEFEYKNDKKEYMRVLDTCIDYYKNNISALRDYRASIAETSISLIITLVAIYITSTIPGAADSISHILSNLANLLTSGTIGFIFAVISILILLSVIIIPSFIVWRITNWLISKVFKGKLEKIFLVKDAKHLEQTLDSLYLAKIEPEKWRLIVEKDEEGTAIKGARVELIEILKKA